MDFYEKRIQLEELNSSIKTSAEALKIPKLLDEVIKLKEEQSKEGFWNDQNKAKSVNMRISNLEKRIATVDVLRKKAENLGELIDLAEEMEDEETTLEIDKLLKSLESESNILFLETLLTGKYDSNNAILSLHAGAGGTEAQDWVEMLYRMYTRYGERAGYALNVLDYQPGDDAGIKSVTFQLSGDNAYGFLKAEKGVHRLVRISPFDANKRRHTSFASLEVMPEILDAGDIIIKPEELRIDTCRSSGAGGQHVNKTESAIRITHLPTGIVTWCQNERSQIQNKETAMMMLIAKLTELKEREFEEEQARIKGDVKRIEWGSQIRSYVFCPYTMVKDHRTGYEKSDINGVMDGDIEGFIFDYLAKSNKDI